MKKLIILSFVLLTSFVFSQAPEEFTYQAVVRDASGNLVVNQSIGVQLSILKSTSVGTAVFVETHSATTNENGLLTIFIGTGSFVTGSFVTIDWSSDVYYLKSEIDITGGTNYTLSGTSKLVSVPYALYAKNSGKTYKIGDLAQGGVVFWVDDSGKHGLVVSKFDVTSSTRWFSGSFGNTHAKGNGLYAGRSNMNIIIASQSAFEFTKSTPDNNTYAARLVNEYQATENGITYGDWYLPSNFELNLLFLNKTAVNTSLTANGGEALSNQNYWSSNEVSNTSASVVNLSSGAASSALKTGANYVRAIRSF